MPLTEADLNASADLIKFMWEAVGNDVSVFTPEVMTTIPALLAQNFGQLTPDLQLIFANGQTSNQEIQAAWNQAGPDVRLAMAAQFQQALSVLMFGSGSAVSDSGPASGEGQSLNADIASNIAWNNSGAGDWSSR